MGDALFKLDLKVPYLEEQNGKKGKVFTSKFIQKP